MRLTLHRFLLSVVKVKPWVWLCWNSSHLLCNSVIFCFHVLTYELTTVTWYFIKEGEIVSGVFSWKYTRSHPHFLTDHSTRPPPFYWFGSFVISLLLFVFMNLPQTLKYKHKVSTGDTRTHLHGLIISHVVYYHAAQTDALQCFTFQVLAVFVPTITKTAHTHWKFTICLSRAQQQSNLLLDMHLSSL